MNISLFTDTVAAAAALTANRFVSHAGGVPSTGGNTLGVTRSGAAAAGDLVPVDIIGTAMVEASAAVAAGAAVETTNDGRSVTKSAGVTVARARTAASGAGVLHEVLLIAN